jgi:hypothetical protein
LCPSLTLIPGATSVEYTPPINGEYAVIVTLANGCSDTSECITINTLDIEEMSELTTLFPNPGNGTFTIKTVQSEVAEISIFDVAGRNHEIETNGDIFTLLTNERGLFFLRVILKNGTQSILPYFKE